MKTSGQISLEQIQKIDIDALDVLMFISNAINEFEKVHKFELKFRMKLTFDSFTDSYILIISLIMCCLIHWMNDVGSCRC